MKYTVVWLASAEQQLADVWLNSNNRKAVQVAANEIERLLKVVPTDFATPVDRGFFLRLEPLVVFFEILDDDRIVRVIDLQSY